MPKAKDVNPAKWTNILVLFDNDEFSLCWGNYDGSSNKILGIRWNDNYPRQGNYPTWFVHYDLFYQSTIKEAIRIMTNDINSKVLSSEEEKTYKEYIDNCNTALEDIKYYKSKKDSSSH